MTKKVKNAPVNEIDETIAASAGFIEKNIKAISIAVVGVLLAVVLSLCIHQYYIVPRKAEAADKIAVSQQLFNTGQYETALHGNGVDAGFLEIVEKYGSTPSGNLASLYAGLCYVHTENYDEAVKYLEMYDECDDLLISNAAIAALGNCYAQLDQNDKAAATLVKAAKRADNATLSPLFYLQAGQIFEELGQKDKALDCFETIKNNYPQSQLVQSGEVMKYIERLK
jgi:tetratricopeptide (TPR) repeat protein